MHVELHLEVLSNMGLSGDEGVDRRVVLKLMSNK
jgi:hypothetical protein